MVDVSKIRPGDKVTVEMEVKRVCTTGDYRGKAYVVCKDPYGDGFGTRDIVPLADAIVSHTPRSLKPGDRVRLKYSVRKEATILAKDGDAVWLKFESGSRQTWGEDELERVSDE